MFAVSHLTLIFHFFGFLNIYRQVASVQVDDDGNGNCSFGGSNRNYKYSEHHTIQPVCPEIFIESNKIDIDTVQDQLNAHQHGDEISSGKKSINTNEEQ